MLHGRRLTPLPQQWMAQMNNAAPVWNAMRQRQAQSAAAQRQRHQQLWEDFEVGAVVILGPEVTKTSYGLHLCNDQGETLLMEGVLMAIEGDFARVRINRSHGKAVPGRGVMTGELQLIRRSDVVRVSDQPPTLWADRISAVKAAAARDGKSGSSYQQYWSWSNPEEG